MRCACVSTVQGQQRGQDTLQAVQNQPHSTNAPEQHRFCT